MMRIGAAALAAIVAAGAQAQEFRGAEVSAEVLGFSDDLGSGQTAYRGSLEMGVWGGIGLQADLGAYGARGMGDEGRNLVLHGTYELGAATGGLFFGSDDLGDSDARLLGIEAAGEFAGGGVQGYLARLGGDAEGTLFGASARYGLGPVGVTGGLDVLGGEDEASRAALGAEYGFGFGPTLFGEVGRVSDDAGDGTYLMLGARIGIGEGGTTFDARSLREVRVGR